MTSASAEAPRILTRGAVATSVLVLLTAALGVWTQSVLAAVLGLSGESDAYFSAFSVATLATFVLQTTVVNHAVPTLSAAIGQAQTPTVAFWRLTRRLAYRVAAIGVVVAVALFAGADVWVTLVTPGLEHESRALAIRSLRVISAPLALYLAASSLVAVQYALQRQAVVQATGPLFTIAVVPALLWLTPTIGPISAAVGTGAAYALMASGLALATWRLASRPASPVPTAAGPPPGPSPTAAVVALAAGLGYAWAVAGPMVASTLAEGAVAEVSFAYRPVDVLARALPTVIGYTAMPTLALALVQDQAARLDATVSSALRLALRLTLPLAAVLVAVREPLVVVLYQRAAFTSEAVQAVAPTLGWYAAALPGIGIQIVLGAIFIATGREGWSAGLNAVFLVTQVPLALLFGRVFGGAGIAFAFFVTAVAVALGGVMVVGRRNAGALVRAAWFRSSVLAALVALGAGTVVVQVAGDLPALLQLGLGASAAVGSAVLVLAWTGDPAVAAARHRLAVAVVGPAAPSYRGRPGDDA